MWVEEEGLANLLLNMVNIKNIINTYENIMKTYDSLLLWNFDYRFPDFLCIKKDEQLKKIQFIAYS